MCNVNAHEETEIDRKAIKNNTGGGFLYVMHEEHSKKVHEVSNKRIYCLAADRISIDCSTCSCVNGF